MEVPGQLPILPSPKSSPDHNYDYLGFHFRGKLPRCYVRELSTATRDGAVGSNPNE